MSETKRPFIISTDSTSDFPASFIKENNLVIHKLHYIVDGETYGDEKELEIRDFFNRMRKGATVSTFATNPDKSKEIFRKQLSEGYDVLHIAFSSGLSSAYSNSVTAAEEVLSEFPDGRIEVIDSLCASGGQGLYVWYALKLQKEGKSMDEIIKWLNSHKMNLCHSFTVDDLSYLHRGGRISKTEKVFGTLLNIKPVLHVDNDGKLVSVTNVRGRKKALNALVDQMESHLGSFRDKNDLIIITHGDCLSDAEYVRDQVKERFGYKNFMLGYLTPTIGSHAGPGTLALFYLGIYR
ncbi:MAG: DegV family protein [Lachnospiraceae bacterium]|nr:DegV family protein [Lachnospiraceae bacterium]